MTVRKIVMLFLAAFVLSCFVHVATVRPLLAAGGDGGSGAGTNGGGGGEDAPKLGFDRLEDDYMACVSGCQSFGGHGFRCEDSAKTQVSGGNRRFNVSQGVPCDHWMRYSFTDCTTPGTPTDMGSCPTNFKDTYADP